MDKLKLPPLPRKQEQSEMPLQQQNPQGGRALVETEDGDLVWVDSSSRASEQTTKEQGPSNSKTVEQTLSELKRRLEEI